MKSLVLVVVLALGTCTSEATASRSVPHSSSRSPSGPQGPVRWVSARVVLPTTTMRTGTSITGQVVVENHSGHVLRASGCLSLLAVLLRNDHVKSKAVWPLCVQPFTIPTGQSTYPITVMARYQSCPPPPCAEGGPPPLPPGDYRATLFRSTPQLPPAPPVEVVVTA
jgi:hypothetical protein